MPVIDAVRFFSFNISLPFSFVRKLDFLGYLLYMLPCTLLVISFCLREDITYLDFGLDSVCVTVVFDGLKKKALRNHFWEHEPLKAKHVAFGGSDGCMLQWNDIRLTYVFFQGC